ncbi:MAG: cytochrome c peroxidase [Bacteroidia bacterium]|jgi:cytochrome c peroxidase
MIGCQTDVDIEAKAKISDVGSIPEGFPAIDFPEDNTFSLERWKLGKRLFFDSRLSKDSTVSCGSCHKPHLAFSDNVAKTNGVFKRSGTRNAPTLTNVAYQPYYTREGGIKTLEQQVLVPIQEHNEFGFNILEITKRLKSDSSYQTMSIKAYNEPLNYSVLVKAIATFERTIISGNSAYDKYAIHGNKTKFSSFEADGMELFFGSKTNCSSCHGGLNFTDYSFQNNGLYASYFDSGRMRLTGEDADDGKFKVPTLRNIGVTAPYMHDGSIETLESVVDHYNTGGHHHRNKSPHIKPLHLTDLEKRQLVAFLHTLTDHDFLNNSHFKNQ